MTAVHPLTARRLDLVLARAQAAGRLPSVAAGVVREGGLAWTHGDPDQQYRIGSITKTMTAVLVLRLRDQGLLDLEDPLAQHLPGTPYGDRSLRGLLSHGGGLPSEPPGEWWERSPGVDLDTLVGRLAGAPEPTVPGATFHYTNVAFALLGAVVGRIRGRDWADVLRDELLEPLGMIRTTVDPAAPYARGRSVHPYAGTLTDEPHHHTGAMAPAGQLWSTVDDLARFGAFLLLGHVDVLAPATLAEMATPYAGLPGDVDGYGLGLRLLRRDGSVLVGHPGSMPGFQASLFVDPRHGTAAVALANATTGLLTEEVTPALLATLEEHEPSLPEPWRPTEHVPSLVEELLGVWHWGNTGFVATWDGTRLTLASLRTGEERETFVLRDGGLVGLRGYHAGERLVVHRGEDGVVSHLEVATFVLTRTPYGSGAPGR